MAILCVSRSFSVALSAYVARRRGEEPEAPLTACARASLVLGCGLSLGLLAVTWLGAAPLLRLAGAQADYLALALAYARPALVSLALSGPAIALHGILAGVGDTKSVLMANVLGNGVNVLFNALLIYGLGPFPRLGGRIMLFVAVVSLPEAWAMIHAGVLRGLGRTGFVAAYSLVSIAVVRPILTFLLVYRLGLGLYGAWIALVLDQTTRAVCSMLGAGAARRSAGP